MTPGVNREKSSAIAQFIDGPEYFESFDEILERTIAFNPTRSESSLRRGILHNAIEAADGRWRWRYDLPRRGSGEGDDGQVMPGLDDLWDAVERRARCRSLSCAAARRRWSTTTTSPRCSAGTPTPGSIVVDGAGHSVQGDKPLELAEILSGLL